jgi:hypothetical protein
LTPFRIGVVVIAATLLLGAVLRDPWVIGVAAVAGAFAFLNARDWEVFGREPFDLPSTAPKISTKDSPSIDLGDELADLLRSASYRARRSLEDSRRLEPFVMYEDAAGNVRIRQVDGSDPDRVLARAREAARAVDESAPRIILAVPSVAEIDDRSTRVVMYEAAERRFRERTLAFVQPYRLGRLIFPTAVAEGVIYVGDAPHTLRYVERTREPTSGATS